MPLSSQWGERVPSMLSAGALSALAAVLVVSGRLPSVDGLWIAVGVMAAYGPSGWVAPIGWKRRAAEAGLIPLAAALLLVPDLIIGRMIMPPLLVGAASAAVWAATSRVESRRRSPVWIGFGVAAFAAGGVGLAGFGIGSVLLALGASVAAPLLASRWGPWPAVASGWLVAALPLQRWPAVSIAVLLTAILLRSWRPASWRPQLGANGWWPAVVAAGIVSSTLSTWPGLLPSEVFPAAGWLCVFLGTAALFLSHRLPALIAGAMWFLVAMSIGPIQDPSPERSRQQLDAARREAVLPVGFGDGYVVDLGLRGGSRLRDGDVVATVVVPGRKIPLTAGSSASERAWRGLGRDVVEHGLPDHPVWRPAKRGKDSVWRVAGRTELDVPRGALPRIVRQPDLPDDVVVVVQSAGTPAAVAPRDWMLPMWLWAAAVMVGFLQLASGRWKSPPALVPWAMLIAGQLAARASVEPLRLVAERYAVDVALAALVAAWVHAAGGWFLTGRSVRAVAALLVPLALATPHLTPPMYGDEPYHLSMMESLLDDRDLDLDNNIDPVTRPSEAVYTLGDRLVHSPVLAFFLLPGFAVAGRFGALALLAVAGVICAALIGRRALELGVPQRRVGALLMGLTITYPLATFSSQIWVELPGALMLAVILVAASISGGRWISAAAALVAAAMKTRLGLITFPAAAVAWMRTGRRSAALGSVVLGLAAVAALAVGWVTMGHPFGYYRRLVHLIPNDVVTPIRVVGGLLFDPAGGLLLTAPLMLAAIAGVGVLWRRGGDVERAAAVGGLATLAALLHSHEWYAGGSPPARYLVPLLPIFAITWGLILKTPYRWRRVGEVLLAPSVAIWWALVTRPQFSVNPGDGSWWLSKLLARRLAADTQALMPSFLAPSVATVVVPLLVVCIGVVVFAASSRSPSTARTLVRSGVACWLIVAVTVTTIAVTRYDRVVEAEAAQVRRFGGERVPPEGTVSRFLRPNGWRAGNGGGVTAPLNLPPDSRVMLEGWLGGAAAEGATIRVRWDDGPYRRIDVGGRATAGRLMLPDPPGPGRHRLEVVLETPPGGTAFFDRIIVDRKP